jgi:hypothetical protein
MDQLLVPVTLLLSVTWNVIVAVSAATSTVAVSLMKSSYWTLCNKVLVKEPSWLPASLVQPADERKEEVYGPGSSSSNSADHQEEEDVHHPKEDIALVNVVEIVGKVSAEFSSAMSYL